MFRLYLACLLMTTALAGVLGDSKLYQVEQKCIQENSLDPEEVKKYSQFQAIPVDNETMLKFEECWIKELNLLDSNDNLDYSALSKIFDDAIATLNTPETAEGKAKLQSYVSKIDICSKKNFGGASQGEIAIKLHNCIVAEMAS